MRIGYALVAKDSRLTGNADPSREQRGPYRERVHTCRETRRTPPPEVSIAEVTTAGRHSRQP